ncbi:hypothetical protein NQ318_013852 [Aromia moschata]|uniref:Aminopeptidase n=1 Tax=Aromia moschata TaxID=1265417 RepID=A0AAV8Z8U2_9CUCU|nr:hypothetical protein NQ318_013852 [Aromia moschata]
MANLRLASLLLLVILLGPSRAQTPEHRLPTNIRPSHYRLHLNLTADVFSEASNQYSGMVIILLTPQQTTSTISLHASHEFLNITLVTLSNTDISPSAYSVNSVTDILTINLPGQIIANVMYQLIIEFTGLLSTAEMTGFYKSNYVDESGATTYLATTQFQPTSARRAFPCFDEPFFKATFDIYITYPLGMNALSNTPGSLFTSDSVSETMKFNTTALMSTYLLAFVVSNFTCTEGTPIEGLPYRICSREETSDIRDWALEIGPKLLDSLNIFTDFNYSLSKDKLDQVAIPDFAAGAMENWGLVTYREMYLLWDPLHSSNSFKQFIATIISHEFAHFWFGNLVTCNWWSETFLNEGFANYYQYHTTHDVLPEWELDKQYVVSNLQPVLITDALENALPLQNEGAATPTEVLAMFGTISYNKGGSIFRMVEHAMTPLLFRTGLRNYMRLQYQTVLPDNLWSTLNAVINNSTTQLPAANLSQVMETWVRSPGFPLLTVSSTSTSSQTTIRISQERFLLSGSDTETKWYVPITYSTSLDSNPFTNTTPQAWLTPDSDLTITIPSGDVSWIVLNNQHIGYYRVTYSTALWNSISQALHAQNFSGIIDVNRAQIVDDLFNLARVNKVAYLTVFNIIHYLENDTSYFPWVPAINGFNFLLARVGRSSTLGSAIGDHVLDLMDNLYESVSFTHHDEDDQIYTTKQVLALSTACRLGHERCLIASKVLFHVYKSSGLRPNKNLRSIVYCNGLRHSTDQSDWEFLWSEYLNASLATEQSTILTALGCSQDEQMLERYLNLSVTDNSGIRAQDALSVFASVYNGNPVGVDVAFRFLRQNHQLIVEKYLSMNALPNLINGLAGVFTTKEQIEELQEFIETGGLPEEYLPAANTALEAALANLQWLETFEGHLHNYFSAGTRTGVGLVLAFFAIVVARLFIK